MQEIVCTGCSCLCDDVVYGDTVYHACRKGYRLLTGKKEENSVNGEKTDVYRALKAARDVIDGKKLLIFGLDNVTCEAQELALKLAKDFNAAIVDHSALSGGKLLELSERLDSVSLEKFRDEGYVSIYWGANPHNSIPRLLSRFTYYPRCGKRQRGYEEDRFLVVADVRKSETAKLAEKSKTGLFIRIEKDDELVDSFLKALNGRAGKYPEVARILKEVEKAEVNAVFGGSGLCSGLKDFDKFEDVVKKSGLYFIPATSKTNMRGFLETVAEVTGCRCYGYDFERGACLNLKDLPEVFACCEAVMVIGADPLRTLPHELSKRLAGKVVVAINSLKSLVRLLKPKVTIASRLSAFSSGTMVRLDGVKVELKGLKEMKESEGETLSDEEVLKELLSM